MLMATLYFLKPARDSLFLSEIGPRQLPFVYLMLAAVAVPVSIFMSKYLREYTSKKVLQGSLLVFYAERAMGVCGILYLGGHLWNSGYFTVLAIC